jgi:hypothetical protein
MSPDEPERSDWRRNGTSPTAGELVVALVVVVLVAIGGVILLGGQISEVLQAQSGTV